MALLMKAVHALVMKANPKQIVESIEAVSPEVRDRLNRSFEQATVDAMLICHLVCKQLLAERMGIDPSSEQANAMMLRLADDPKFAHRVRRLFGEAQKSSDRRRRVFLASVLYGLPDSKMLDDERDRVDMAAERLTVPDVQFLAMLWEKRRTPELHQPDGISYIFGDDGLGAVITGTSLRIATPNEWTGNDFVDGFLEDPRFVGDRAALSSLVSVGCIDVGETVMSLGYTQRTHHLRLLPLAHLVVQALQEVGAGFAVAGE